MNKYKNNDLEIEVEDSETETVPYLETGYPYDKELDFNKDPETLYLPEEDDVYEANSEYFDEDVT